ncbi:MAG: twin-arginine translocase subunit TatB [Candidatus Schekmanbacteria bacterium]|nr:twin-arginine translocase subunit TatB [Candidatus Schekmanbacteria bacterium]
MFPGLGIWEIVVILIVALVVVGPRKLPDVARTVGKSLAEFRRAAAQVRSSLEAEVREVERTAGEAKSALSEPGAPDVDKKA